MSLYVKKVSGDGNCLLNSVCCQVDDFTVKSLRKELWREYKRNWKRYKDYIEDPRVYAEKIKKDGVWLDETDIVALTHITESIIELYIDTLDKPYQIYGKSNKHNSDSVIRVIYVNNNHYDAVLKRDLSLRVIKPNYLKYTIYYILFNIVLVFLAMSVTKQF